MAKAKEWSPKDAILEFKAAMLRASLSDYLYVNRILFSTTKTGGSVLVVPDEKLWCMIIDDKELNVKELNILSDEGREISEICKYAENMDDPTWVEIDSDSFVKGEISQISVPGIEYHIPLNRDLLPLKLRKSETNNIAYRILTTPKLVILIRKRFETKIPGYGYTILRAYEIV